MAKAIVTADKDAVVSEVEIAAPPARVFQALITREQALQWGGGDAFQVTAWEMDARPGGDWRFVSREKGSDREFDHHGKVVEVDPPHVLVYTWFANWHSDPLHQTMVRWDLIPTPTGTRVKVTHSGLAQLPEACAGYSQGWPGLLDGLRKFLEK
jgi:uncharacterized protein YndB with AHSA1/START domain